MDEVFFPYNIPSLKNSKQWTGKHLVKSKQVQKYLRLYGIKSYNPSKKTVDGYIRIPNTFRPLAMQVKALLADKSPPYCLEFYFIRQTKAKFDFGNAIELLSDLFTAHCVWEDDNCDYFLPFPRIINGSCYYVDKDNPGVIVRIKPE